jgi:membrane fusion protein (multidrug efflux system)
MIVQTDGLWVTANFKETQLERMHAGQRVKVHVDAMHRDFAAIVESMPAITGSRTSILPPENATGNYVKVIQRMPVRIRFNPGQKELDKLRPGMSVEPKVYVE